MVFIKVKIIRKENLNELCLAIERMSSLAHKLAPSLLQLLNIFVRNQDQWTANKTLCSKKSKIQISKLLRIKNHCNTIISSIVIESDWIKEKTQKIFHFHSSLKSAVSKRYQLIYVHCFGMEYLGLTVNFAQQALLM